MVELSCGGGSQRGWLVSCNLIQCDSVCFCLRGMSAVCYFGNMSIYITCQNKRFLAQNCQDINSSYKFASSLQKLKTRKLTKCSSISRSIYTYTLSIIPVVLNSNETASGNITLVSQLGRIYGSLALS